VQSILSRVAALDLWSPAATCSTVRATACSRVG
jgi:hypothetical protein